MQCMKDIVMNCYLRARDTGQYVCDDITSVNPLVIYESIYILGYIDGILYMRWKDFGNYWYKQDT